MHPGTFSIHIISLDQTNGYINSMMQCQLNMAFSPSLFCNTKIHLFFNYGHFIQAKALQNKRSEIVLNCFKAIAGGRGGRYEKGKKTLGHC